MWDALTTEFGFEPGVSLTAIVARMLGATLFCGLIGCEREASHRPAGLRTHMLIGIAACVCSLLGLALLARTSEFTDTVRIDPLRLIEAVTSGVAFLAAGLIVFAQGKVRGLTTGASMGLAAAVGVACGIGEWTIALLITMLALIVIVAVRQLERSVSTRQNAED